MIQRGSKYRVFEIYNILK